MYICWQITWRKWHKIWHADLFRWLNLGRHRYRWVLLSLYAFVRQSNSPWACILVLRTNLLKENVYILSCWYLLMSYPMFIYGHCCYCPSGLSVRLFNTFSGLFAFAEKHLGRNGIIFGLLMYPDDWRPYSWTDARMHEMTKTIISIELFLNVIRYHNLIRYMFRYIKGNLQTNYKYF